MEASWRAAMTSMSAWSCPPRAAPTRAAGTVWGGSAAGVTSGTALRPPPTGAPPMEHPPLHCIDMDECMEGGSKLCGGGSICINTPGSFECLCPPGYSGDPPGPCWPVTVPPELCDDKRSCALTEALTLLHGRLREGGDPHLILQDLVSALDAALGGGSPPPPPPPPPGSCGGWGHGCPPPSPPSNGSGVTASVSSGSTELLLSLHRDPPPGPVRMELPTVTLSVPGEVAWDRNSGLALVALLVQGGVGVALGGAPLEGEGAALPPPRLLTPVVTALVGQPRPPPTPEVTLSFQYRPPPPRVPGAGAPPPEPPPAESRVPAVT
ncbi:formin-like protein 20 [Melopsittacus undulatus]|uniref:formin-like protein 20 n=1 Tax=Melopsittacus undulatus TaxID=13146 RepID=UPI00146F26E4|nr:formin-like protein 20 [Melopsittacus undulatus]